MQHNKYPVFNSFGGLVSEVLLDSNIVVFNSNSNHGSLRRHVGHGQSMEIIKWELYPHALDSHMQGVLIMLYITIDSHFVLEYPLPLLLVFETASMIM